MQEGDYSVRKYNLIRHGYWNVFSNIREDLVERGMKLDQAVIRTGEIMDKKKSLVGLLKEGVNLFLKRI